MLTMNSTCNNAVNSKKVFVRVIILMVMLKLFQGCRIAFKCGEGEQSDPTETKVKWERMTLPQ